MSLFTGGQFILHSGNASTWKVECEALTQQDWEALARIAWLQGLRFQSVEGIPRGGLPFAKALLIYATQNPNDPCLICDDVLTTGRSMEVMRAQYGQAHVRGLVAFARGPCPWWVRAMWQFGL